MKIVDFLNEKAISADLKATTKEGIIRELVDTLAKAEGIKNKEELFKVLLNRESLGSTGIGQGVVRHDRTGADPSRDNVLFQALWRRTDKVRIRHS